ncbi:MAG TPA: DUF3606 domain-containing protein [Burkholderiaceae bacterium]|nr:DUF3606 domain-containing protein [Burkholderiaceae bacterium]
MADDRKLRRGADLARINVDEDRELRDWSLSLGVPPDRIRQAVLMVGNRADRVCEYLNERGKPPGGDRYR